AVSDNAFFSPDPDKVPELEAYMDQLRRDQDSVGAKITVVAEGVPPGLGEPVFDRLDAELAYALMSINAVKGVEIGAGFASVAQRGTEHRDELTLEGFTSNNAGRSEEHTSELQSRENLVCRLLLEKKKQYKIHQHRNT